LGPAGGLTIPCASSRFISCPASLKPTCSFSWSIEVDPNCVLTSGGFFMSQLSANLEAVNIEADGELCNVRRVSPG